MSPTQLRPGQPVRVMGVGTWMFKERVPACRQYRTPAENYFHDGVGASRMLRDDIVVLAVERAE